MISLFFWTCELSSAVNARLLINNSGNWVELDGRSLIQDLSLSPSRRIHCVNGTKDGPLAHGSHDGNPDHVGGGHVRVVAQLSVANAFASISISCDVSLPPRFRTWGSHLEPLFGSWYCSLEETWFKTSLITLLTLQCLAVKSEHCKVVRWLLNLNGIICMATLFLIRQLCSRLYSSSLMAASRLVHDCSMPLLPSCWWHVDNRRNYRRTIWATQALPVSLLSGYQNINMITFVSI